MINGGDGMAHHFGEQAVVIGGSLAGLMTARVLADHFDAVTVLERQERYRDRVRGEGIHPWGVAEAQHLGLYRALLDAGAHLVASSVTYDPAIDPEDALAQAIPTGGVFPGVPGRLNVSHPSACEVLAATAAREGATVLRGVTHVEVRAGERPAVRFRHGGTSRQLDCRLVVGADGRSSRVRRQIGIELERAPETHMISGLLVDDLDTDDRYDVIGMADRAWNVTFPQGGGRARVYLCPGTEDPRRFAGPDGTARFLQASVLAGAPDGEAWASATPVGPCRTFPADDTWTDRPFVEGVVIIGDAAGHNNPLIGQGVALAFRDVRDLSEVLLNGHRWDGRAFTNYGAARAERLRRMRFVAQLLAPLATTFGPEGHELRRDIRRRLAQDPSLRAAHVVYTGPDALDPDLCTEEFRRRYLGHPTSSV
jgi:menaquinone-9 beta-reductase